MAAGRSGGRWRRVRAEVLAESDVCHYCGQPGSTTVDHLQALAEGGDPYDRANLRPAHLKCNSKRGAGTADQLRRSRARSRAW